MMGSARFGALVAGLAAGAPHTFRRWRLKPGMAFGADHFWWPAAGKKRPRPHEGIDFFCYEDTRKRVHYLAGGLVPCPCHGEVVGLCPDFLGHSVFVRAAGPCGPGIYVLAHVAPSVDLGQIVAPGQGVGTVAAGTGRVPGHLHVSLLGGGPGDLPAQLSWPALLAQEKLQWQRPFC
jgi:hypothetical protein